jgi:hypothetical protein
MPTKFVFNYTRVEDVEMPHEYTCHLVSIVCKPHTTHAVVQKGRYISLVVLYFLGERDGTECVNLMLVRHERILGKKFK